MEAAAHDKEIVRMSLRKLCITNRRNMRSKWFLYVFCLGFVTNVVANPVPEGKTIFMNRCAACHNVNKKLTGPALAGVDNRHNLDWIVRFVQSSQTVIKG